MAKIGLLIDTYYCTGCHSCEMACQMEHGHEIGKTGIQVFDIGPWKIGGDKWQLTYNPVPTMLCDMCETRVGRGKKPACVHNCQATCMEYGTLEELTEKAKGMKMAAIYMPDWE